MQTLAHDEQTHEFGRCANCGYTCGSLLITVLPNSHQNILAQWKENKLLPDEKICFRCEKKIKKCENEENPIRQYGHNIICIACGRTVQKKRVNRYTNEDELLLLCPWYKHYKRPETPCITCSACHKRLLRKQKNAKELQNDCDMPNSRIKIENKEIVLHNIKTEANNSEDFINVEPVNEQVIPDEVPNVVTHVRQIIEKRKEAVFENDRLILPDYKRVLISRGKCVAPKCKAAGQLISKWKRKLIFLQTNTLLTRRASLCKQHEHFDNWGSYGCNNFTMIHVEEALSMCEKPVPIIDFDGINEMPDHICKYWTGLSTDEFKDLYEKLNVSTSLYPSLRNALAIHLLRKKTGDSLMKLANLFLMTIPRLSKQLLVIEKCFEIYDRERQTAETS